MEISPLQLTEYGTIDLDFYQRQAEKARTEAMSDMMQNLKSWIKARTKRSTHATGNLTHAH